MNFLSISFVAIISFSTLCQARDLNAIEKLAKNIILISKEDNILKFAPPNTRILLFDKDTRTVVLQEQTGACYVLFESTISPANHRFGTIIMTDGFSLPREGGGFWIWESALIESITVEQIKISLHRSGSLKSDIVTLLRSDPKQNAVWKFKSIEP